MLLRRHRLERLRSEEAKLAAEQALADARLSAEQALAGAKLPAEPESIRPTKKPKKNEE